MTQKIEGIIPVMITPFTANGQIDYPGLGRLVEWYIDQWFGRAVRGLPVQRDAVSQPGRTG